VVEPWAALADTKRLHEHVNALVAALPE